MDPITQQPQPPESMQTPTAPELAPTSTTQSGMSPEEMQKDLDMLMEAINNKKKMLDGVTSSADSQFKQMQDEAIANLFEILQKNGVDPSNQEEVAAFLNQLKEENPEGYKILEAAIDGILNGGQVQDMTAPDPNLEPAPSPMDAMSQLPPQVPGPDMNDPVNQVPQLPPTA